MNKFYLTLSLSIIFNLGSFLKAQSEIWGLNASGGNGFGVLYGMPTGATTPTTQFNFTGNPGSNPQYTKLLEASNGKLYGMTNSGGLNNVGIIFEYDTATSVYTRKIDFTTTNGANPKGALIQAADGKLYGMTQLGGANNLGVIFSYDIATNTQSVLVNFTGNTGSFPGSQPFGTLLQPNPAVTKLYGMTRLGGANSLGTLFEYDYGTGTYTDKVDFNGSTSTALGSNPFGQLVKAVSASSSTTTLYGLTSLGGTSNLGVLFEYDYALNVFTKKVNLTAATGSSPQGSLLLASNGRLYGTTMTGGASTGGVIFDYVISSNTFTKRTDLTSGTGSTGGVPLGELTQASNGKIYGLTRSGGATNVGVIFEYDVSTPTSPVYTKKADFAAANGSNPFGSLMQVSTGKLYGVTSAGGSVSGGVLFQYSMGASSYTKKIDFNSSNGGTPSGGLMQASNGKFYGLTAVGGNLTNLGVIFEYDKSTGTYTKKIDFTGNAGANPGSSPFGSMIQVGASKLYGLTSGGGTGGNGTIFSYDIGTGVQAKLIDFTGASGLNQGGAPFGSLAQFTGTGTASGKLYGMTKQGGASNQGVIFEFDPTGSTYTKKIDLSAANGYSAFGSMVQSGSLFYGMTQLGGSNGFGVIFQYDPNTNTYTKKVDFTGTAGAAPGSLPFGSLVETATVGILYGMTKTGGASDLGVIFEYNVSTTTYTKKIDLSTANGSQPLGSLIKAANNKLYGKTNTGGANGSGVIFEYDVTTATYTKKVDFTTASGNFPTYTQLLEVCTKPLTPGSITSLTNTLCESDASAKNFSITVIPNATSYTWTVPAGASITSGSTSSAINANLGALAAGSYTYGVSGINICGTGTLSMNTVTVNPLPTVTANSGQVCAGSTFTITPGGVSTFTIEGGSALVSPSGNTTYTVIGTSSLGCLSSNTATSSVVVNALPTIGVNSGTICAGNAFTMIPTGVISSTPSGGSLIVSPGTTTLYTIIGTDGNNCVSANTATANVTVNILPTIGVNSATMCENGSVIITPFGAGTGASYDVAGFSGAGPFVYAPSSSTVISATATTSFGCASANTATSSVTVYTLPIISVNSPTMCFGSNAVIIPTGAGASGTYTTGALNGSGSFTVNPSSTTNYIVSGTSAQGCISASSATSAVTVYTLPVVTVNSGSVCSGSPYTFIPNGAANYTFSGPVTGTSFTVSPSSSASYTIAGISADGCVSAAPATANLTVYALPTLSVSNGVMCAGVGFTLNPQGAANYTIQPNSLFTSGTVVVTPSVTTAYIITGVSSFGCISATTAVSTVTVLSLPVITATDGAVCLGSVYTASVSGANTYTYINATSNLNPAGTLTLSPAASTSFSVYGTDNLGCSSTSAVIMSITVNALPVITISGTTGICLGDNTTLIAGGGNVYNWGVSTNSILVVNPIASAVYTLVGTDLNSCTNTATFSLTVNPHPTVTIISGAICPGNSYTFTPGGASTYTFSNGSGVVSPTTTTSYSVTGTSTAGCISLLPAVATVSVVNILTVTVSGNTVVCAGGTVNLTANGAGTYSWSTGAPTNTLSTIPASNTTYTVVGSSGTCNDTAIVSITINQLPNVSAVAQRTMICVSESVELTAGGATNYVWSTNANTSNVSVSPIVSTTYTVTGTDVNGCEKTGTVTVVVNACTGIGQITGNSWNYALYPNPNSGEFVIETSSQISATVINALGEVVLKQQLNEGKNAIDLNEQSRGIYFVQIKNGNSIKTIKIIKQ